MYYPGGLAERSSQCNYYGLCVCESARDTTDTDTYHILSAAPLPRLRSFPYLPKYSVLLPEETGKHEVGTKARLDCVRSEVRSQRAPASGSSHGAACRWPARSRGTPRAAGGDACCLQQPQCQQRATGEKESRAVSSRASLALPRSAGILKDETSRWIAAPSSLQTKTAGWKESRKYDTRRGSDDS